MASKPQALVGVHYVRRRLSGNNVRWHVYAWRGGPKIMEGSTILKPRLTPEAVSAYYAAHASTVAPPECRNFRALVELYQRSPEYKMLADATKKSWRPWIEGAKTEFGDAPLSIFNTPRMRGEILAWRDKWAHAPRQADFAMQVVSRILSFGVDRGKLSINLALGGKLYKADRSDIIWDETEIDAVAARMQPHVANAFRLAAWTGLPRTDLLSLRWDEVHEDHIFRKRHKTGVVQMIPLRDEARTLIQLLGKKKTAVTVVVNRRGAPFTPREFSRAIERARKAAGVAEGKTLHDLRGTFATRLMAEGFEDREIDAILGWAPGKSERVRRHYISRKSIIKAGLERVRHGGRSATSTNT